MASNVVETISLNYEDFNDSFLTCATCLCRYDNIEHVPKLLPCSHTLCVQCLQRIAENASKSSSNSGTRGLPSTSNNAAVEVANSDGFPPSTPTATAPAGVVIKIRCPICRNSIPLAAQGGVHALPPSFLINQLLDLIGSMRKNVVMKCSSHTTEDLMFCETCDETFCMLCHSIRRSSLEQQTTKPFVDGRIASSSSASDNDMNSDYDSGCDDSTRRRSPAAGSATETNKHRGASHRPSNKKISCDHSANAVPVTIAAKRLSNILNYKAIGCRSLVDKGLQQISTELRELDRQTHAAVDKLRSHCDALKAVIDDEFGAVNRKLMTVHAQKRQVLEEQLKLVGQERAKIDENSDFGQENVSLYTNDSNATSGSAANNDTDSNNITRLAATINLHSMAEKISILSNLMVDMPILCEPRENGYVQFVENGTTFDALRTLCTQLGAIRFSSTMPSISPLEPPAAAQLTNNPRRHELRVGLCDIAGILQCFDCHGRRRIDGGDPVEAFVVCDDDSRHSAADLTNNVFDDTVACHVVDRNDGSYEIRCRPPRAATFKLHVRLFGRSVKSSPLVFYAVSNYPPESSTSGVSSPYTLSLAEHGDDDELQQHQLTDNNEHGEEFGVPFCQPAAIVYDASHERLLVVDTGNERLVVVSRDLKRILRVFNNLPGMELHGATGATMLANGNVVLVNWRTRYITECSLAEDCGQNVPADQMLLSSDEVGRRSTSFSSSSAASMKSVPAVIEYGNCSIANGAEPNENEIEKRKRLVKRFTHQDLKTPMKIDYRLVQQSTSANSATVEELLVVDNDANALFVFDYRTCKLKRKMTWPTLMLGEAAGRLPMHAATWWNNIGMPNSDAVAKNYSDCSTCASPPAGDKQLSTLPSSSPVMTEFVVTDNLVRIYTKNGALLYQLGAEAKPAIDAALSLLNNSNRGGLPHNRRHVIPLSTYSGDGSTLRSSLTSSLAGSCGSHTLRADSVNTTSSSSTLLASSSSSRDNKFSSLKRLRAKSTHYYATLHSFFQPHADGKEAGGGDAEKKEKAATTTTKSSTFVSRWKSTSKSSKKKLLSTANTISIKNVNDDDESAEQSTQASDVRVVIVPWNRENEDNEDINGDDDGSPPLTSSGAADLHSSFSTKSASNISLDSLVGLPYGEDVDDSLFMPTSTVSSTVGKNAHNFATNSVYAGGLTPCSSSYTAVAIDTRLNYVLCARTVRGKDVTIEVHAVGSISPNSTNSGGDALGLKNALDLQYRSGTSSNRQSLMLSGANASIANAAAGVDCMPTAVLRIDSRGARLRNVCSLAVDIEHRRVYACDAVAGSIKMFRYA